MFRNILASGALMIATSFLTPAIAGEANMPRSISLSGHGEVRLAPDLAIISAGVLSQGTAANEALAANTKSMQAVFAALKGAGVEDKDVQTSNFSVQPRYNYNNEGRAPSLAGYDVSNTVTITVRDLDRLGAVLDQVVTSGSNQINGIRFDVANPASAKDAARALAMADARHKADVYAAAGNIALGQIMSIAEGGSYQPSAPAFRATMMRAEGAADVPIAGGEQSLSVDVNVVWEIN